MLAACPGAKRKTQDLCLRVRTSLMGLALGACGACRSKSVISASRKFRRRWRALVDTARERARVCRDRFHEEGPSPDPRVGPRNRGSFGRRTTGELPDLSPATGDEDANVLRLFRGFSRVYIAALRCFVGALFWHPFVALRRRFALP